MKLVSLACHLTLCLLIAGLSPSVAFYSMAGPHDVVNAMRRGLGQRLNSSSAVRSSSIEASPQCMQALAQVLADRSKLEPSKHRHQAIIRQK